MTLPVHAAPSRIPHAHRRKSRAAVWGLVLCLQLAAADLPLPSRAAPSPIKNSAAPSAPVPAIGARAASPAEPLILPPALAALPDLTNPIVPLPATSGTYTLKLVTNAAPADLVDYFAPTNGLPRKSMSTAELLVHLKQRLEIARYLRATRQPDRAAAILEELLDDRSPETLQQTALLELAAAAQDQNDLPRAQQIYAQFLAQWPNDLRTPEILLREGMLFRQMGLYNLAFTKLYGVMTSALVLKNDQIDYYVRLVLQAQTEIAETQYELGKYAEAAELFARLLKQNNPSINKSQIVYKLLRCRTALGNYAETVSDAEDYLARYPDAPEQPEIRFYLALALKQLKRNADSLQQVLLLLQEQRARTKGRPELWAYWQQRAGNLIANQLYQEGDYTRALEVYLRLAQIDLSPQWQVPVLYQIGVTYERLWQPQKAAETYNSILSRESQVGTNASPDLKTVFDMTRWRIGFLQWQNQAETANRQLRAANSANSTNAAVTASLSGTLPPSP